MSNTATALVGGLLLAAAAGIGGYGYGLDQGKALEKGRQDGKALETITDQIAAHADLVKRSGAASKGMRSAVAQLEKANTQTTTEIADALTTTAPERADCVFPPDVVRGLQGARDRAAEAAASGIRGALPSAPTSAPGPAGGPDRP